MTDTRHEPPPCPPRRAAARSPGAAGTGRDGGDDLSSSLEGEYGNPAVPTNHDSLPPERGEPEGGRVSPSRRRYLPQESARVFEKLRAGAELRFRVVLRRTPALALRLAFSDGDVVTTQTVEGLLNRGLVTLDVDGAVRLDRTAKHRWPEDLS